MREGRRGETPEERTRGIRPTFSLVIPSESDSNATSPWLYSIVFHKFHELEKYKYCDMIEGLLDRQKWA